MNENFAKFSLLRYVNNSLDQVYPFKARERAYMDVTYCIKGELEYEYNGETIKLYGGDAVIFPPYTTRLRHTGNLPTHYASFNVFLPEDYELPVSGIIRKCITADTAYLIELFGNAWESVSKRRSEKCLGIFTYLFSELIDACEDCSNPHVNRIKRYIMDNLSKRICISDISKEVHLVPQYVCALFKKHMGMTIIEYLDRERIDLAKRLMIISDSPLYTIAEECGFPDYNYFSSTFRKYTGRSARAYRKSNGK